MFTVQNLGATEINPFVGGAPSFQVYSNGTRYYSPPIGRILSNDIGFRFIIANVPAESSQLWVNDTGVLSGSQEISIDLSFLLSGSSGGFGGNIKFSDPVNPKDSTFTGVFGTPVTISSTIQLDNWQSYRWDSDTRNILRFCRIDKVILGSRSYSLAVINEAVDVDANGNEIFLALPAGKFYMHFSSSTLRLQTFDNVHYVGNQPLKVYGRASIGANLSIITPGSNPQVLIGRNNGINQGDLGTTF